MFASWRARRLLEDVRAYAESTEDERLASEDLADKFARVGLGRSFMPADLSIEGLPTPTEQWMRRNASRPVHIPLQFHLRAVRSKLRGLEHTATDISTEPTLHLIAEFLCGDYAHDFYCAPHRILDKFGVTATEEPLLREVFKTSARVAREVARSW